jgi:hypothetical protein
MRGSRRSDRGRPFHRVSKWSISEVTVGLDVRRGIFMGRCEPATGIEPFGRLVTDVMERSSSSSLLVKRLRTLPPLRNPIGIHEMDHFTQRSAEGRAVQTIPGRGARLRDEHNSVLAWRSVAQAQALIAAHSPNGLLGPQPGHVRPPGDYQPTRPGRGPDYLVAGPPPI